VKKQLYISIAHSQLLFYSILWKPHLIKDINLIERIQKRATKFILNDYTIDYKTRLLKLKLLLLVYTFDINDIIFLIRSIKFPSNSFNIKDFEFITFISGNSRLANNHKLQHAHKKLCNNFYFNRIARIWNALPVVDCNLSILPLNFVY